jgi:site-specific recombinase XerD
MTLAASVEAFLAHLTPRRSVLTIKLYQNTLAEFLTVVGSAPEVSAAHFQLYLKRLDQRALTKTTRYSNFLRIRSWLAWAVQNGHLFSAPSIEFPAPRRTLPKSACPSKRQIEKLLAIPDQSTLLDERNLVALELAYGTGLRRGELSRLDLQDFQRKPASILVRCSKGQKDRWVPIGDHLAQILETYISEIRPRFQPAPTERALFVSQNKKRWPGYMIARYLQRYARQAGLPALNLHALRHAYATHLLQAGAQLHEVRRLLGHSRIDTTEIYTHLLPLDLIREHQRTHPRARRQP